MIHRRFEQDPEETESLSLTVEAAVAWIDVQRRPAVEGVYSGIRPCDTLTPGK